MGSGLVAFLLAAGAGAWIYNKMMRQTGGIVKTALIVAGVCAAILFFVVLFILGFLPD